jgi:hypothetical protein
VSGAFLAIQQAGGGKQEGSHAKTGYLSTSFVLFCNPWNKRSVLFYCVLQITGQGGDENQVGLFHFMQQSIGMNRKHAFMKLDVFSEAHKLDVEQSFFPVLNQEFVDSCKHHPGIIDAGKNSLFWYKDRDMFHDLKLSKYFLGKEEA